MSGKRVISSPGAPAAVGPYSQAVRAGDFVFCSGQIPVDPATGELVSGGVGAQTERCIQNLMAVAAGAGATLADVVKTTVFLTDLGAFQEMNGVYSRYFGPEYPARSTIQVAGLPKGASVEIEAVIALSGK